MGCWEDANLVNSLDDITGQRVNVVELIHVVAEEFDAHRALLVGGNDVHCVALNAERTAGKAHVIALILNINEQAEETVTVDLLAFFKHHGSV